MRLRELTRNLRRPDTRADVEWSVVFGVLSLRIFDLVQGTFAMATGSLTASTNPRLDITLFVLVVVESVLLGGWLNTGDFRRLGSSGVLLSSCPVPVVEGFAVLSLYSWRRNGASFCSAAGSRVSSSASAAASVSAAARDRAAKSPLSPLCSMHHCVHSGSRPSAALA